MLELFGTRSWTAVENLSLEVLQKARNNVWLASRGHAYGEGPPPESESAAPAPEAKEAA